MEVGLHRPVRLLTHERHDGARVDAAAEERADRHVADHPGPHGPPQLLKQPLLQRLRGPRVVVGEGHLPERLVGPDALAVDDQVVAGVVFLDALEHRPGRHHLAEGEEVVEGFLVELCTHPGQRQQRLDLGGEREEALLNGIVQRLDPDAVPGQQQRLPFRIPERQGEHAVHPVQEAGPLPLVEVEQDLRVSSREEPLPMQLRLERLEVVDLPVEHEGRPLRRQHGLVPGRARGPGCSAAGGRGTARALGHTTSPCHPARDG